MWSFWSSLRSSSAHSIDFARSLSGNSGPSLAERRWSGCKAARRRGSGLWRAKAGRSAAIGGSDRREIPQGILRSGNAADGPTPPARRRERISRQAPKRDSPPRGVLRRGSTDLNRDPEGLDARVLPRTLIAGETEEDVPKVAFRCGTKRE